MNAVALAFSWPPRPTADPSRAGSEAKLRKSAQEFEAVLLNSLLQSMHDSFCNLPGDDSKKPSDDYSYMGTQALAPQLAARGGLGIARMIVKNLQCTVNAGP